LELDSWAPQASAFRLAEESLGEAWSVVALSVAASSEEVLSAAGSCHRSLPLIHYYRCSRSAPLPSPRSSPLRKPSSYLAFSPEEFFLRLLSAPVYASKSIPLLLASACLASRAKTE
jgi:hypothetical protein